MTDREFSDIRMARDLAIGLAWSAVFMAATVLFVFWCVELV